MIVLAGVDIVLPDRIVTGSLLIEGARIAAVDPRARIDPAGATVLDLAGHYVVPGFIDVHVHGVEGYDTLDGGRAIQEIAARLPRYGVTAFCPTTVACSPLDLRGVLSAVRTGRAAPGAASSRVLPAHLESNFINPAYKGAQPLACLRRPDATPGEGDFAGRDVLDVIDEFRADIGVVTLAPEIPGGLDLVSRLAAAGHRVSLGHSGATFDEANAAIDAGACHATHLFNRMAPMTHREPGLPGAVLSRPEVAVELICDGHHVHPAMCRTAMAAKGRDGVMAITDGTAGSGLPVGAVARLGGRPIRVGERAALLPDGTWAGSTLTMDRAFAMIVAGFGLSIVDAAVACSTTPARQLGLEGFGVLAEGRIADVVVLDRAFRVVKTFVDGREIYPRSS